MAKTLGDSVKSFRRKYKITQVDFAAKIGTTQPNVSRIERGRSFPSMALFQKITRFAKKYGATIQA